MTAPIACTLSGADMAARLASIAALNRDALRTERRAGLTLELEYDPAAGDRVREFVRLEQACCGFLHFEVRRTVLSLFVRVTAPPEAATAAEALFDQFSAMSTEARCSCC